MPSFDRRTPRCDSRLVVRRGHSLSSCQTSPGGTDWDACPYLGEFGNCGVKNSIMKSRLVVTPKREQRLSYQSANTKDTEVHEGNSSTTLVNFRGLGVNRSVRFYFVTSPMNTPKGGSETSSPALVDCGVAARLLKFAFAKPCPLRSNFAFCGEPDMLSATRTA